MKLLRLEVQGFKSFKDKTTINFDEGITGIVGPNGCGKSNIVDALFWVMGEQSAKHLRGNKMKDLIFAGSSKYSPATWAEVTLVLLNDNGKHIHIGQQVVRPQEIALTRKLYRNGETEYRINNIPARLKDIQEVFMDTGAGAKSYSIIAQGEINRLVQAKPQERRVMIEEVAGITKFKMRKRESLKKIEHTQSNLERLSDLQTEIYKQLKSLEVQAEKAQKARSLKEKIKRHELVAMSHREFDYLNDFLHASESLNKKTTLLEDLQIAKNKIELTLEDERLKKDEFTSQIDELSYVYNDLSKELAKNEERVKHLKNAFIDKEKLLQNLKEEREEILKDIKERKSKLTELQEKQASFSETNYAEMDFSEQEERVDNLKENLQEKEEQLSQTQLDLKEVQSTLQKLEQQAFKNESKLTEYANALEDMAVEIEEIEKQTSNAIDQLVEKREQTKIKHEEVLKLKNIKEELSSDLKDKTEEFKLLDQNLRELSREVIQLESKRQSLIDINTQEGSEQEGLQQLTEALPDENIQQLGQLIESDPKYAKAVEKILAHILKTIVLPSDSVHAWLAAHNDLSISLLSALPEERELNTESIERLMVRSGAELTALSEIVSINDQELASKLAPLFEGYYLAEDFDYSSAQKLTCDLPFKGIVATDGKLAAINGNNGVIIALESTENQVQGIVERNNLIKDLSEQLDNKQVLLKDLEEKEVILNERLDSTKAELDKISEEYDIANQAYLVVKSSLESQESSSDQTTTRLDILKKRKAETSTKRLELLEDEEQVENLKIEKQTQKDQLEELLENINSELDDLRSVYEEERHDLLESKANAKTYHAQLDAINSQVHDANEQITKYESKIEQGRQREETLGLEMDELEVSIKEISENNDAQVAILSERSEQLSLLKDEFSQLLLAMQEREDEVKKMSVQINKLEKENVEHELKMEKVIADEEVLVKDCFDRYRVNLRSCISESLEVFDSQLAALADISDLFVMETEEGPKEVEQEAYHFEKKFPAQVKESREKYKRYKSDLNRLGEINWQAVDDYDRQKLRYDFLRQQEIELKKSLDDLELAISHIDEKSRIRFKEAYTEVNERFTKVFPIIFGGGEARLNIVGDLDSDDCGIDIIAQPPGKKMQSINLMSGGEKAMTAVSLIFSIFLVKPSPFCLLDEVDAPLDDANVGRFNELLREMSSESQFILITHNKKTMELNDSLYGVTMQEPGVSKAVSVQLH